jgi:integrase
MKGVRGIKPDPRGTGSWYAQIVDPFQKKSRRFFFETEEQAAVKKVDVLAKIKAIQAGQFTVPEGVDDIVLWLVKDGQKGLRLDQYGAIRPSTIDQLIDAYLGRQEERATISGDGGISTARFANEKQHLEKFDIYCREHRVLAIGEALSAENLERYKAHASNVYPSKYTLRDATYAIKAMVMWAWETKRIEDVPRNLASFRRVVLPDPAAIVFTKDEINALLDSNSMRIRLYVLLALNAGYTQQDISDLRHESIDLKAGIITEVRGKVAKKVKIPRVVKLWPSTLRECRLAASATSVSEHVFLSDEGNILVRRLVRDGKTRNVDCIQSTFQRVKKTAKIGKKSFKHLRKTGADLIKNDFPGATTKTNAQLFDMYLAHKPRKIEMAYDPGDWKELHKATDWLGQHLGLFQD